MEITDNLVSIWQPQPGPQTLLIKCPVFEVFFGGARGGGKTESSIGDWLLHSSTYGQAAIGLFVRRHLTELREVKERTNQIFPKLGAKFNKQSNTWTMANGARLIFAYLEHDEDAALYQGHSYTRVYVEEATNFPSPTPINMLRATLRSTVAPVGMRLTGNPGGAGHGWVKARYIDPAPSGNKIITESTTIIIDGKEITVSLSRVFIPSKLTDNKLLLEADPTYVLRLKQSGSEALVRAWLEGDWSVIDGAFFDFDPNLHVIRLSPDQIFKNLPQNTEFFRAFDWGSSRPFSVGWYAFIGSDMTINDPIPRIIPAKSLIKITEWYGASGINTGLKLTSSQVARGIKERESKFPVRFYRGFADPAIFKRDGGESIADTMAIQGVMWGRGDNSRIPGWQQMQLRLRGENNSPLLYFGESCVDTIRTLPLLQHDSAKAEDLDSDAEDHAADETRYACMSRPYVAKTPFKILPAWEMSQIPISTLIKKQSAKLKGKLIV